MKIAEFIELLNVHKDNVNDIDFEVFIPGYHHDETPIKAGSHLIEIKKGVPVMRFIA